MMRSAVVRDGQLTVKPQYQLMPTTTDRIIAANRTQQHGKRRLAMYNASILSKSSFLLALSSQKTCGSS